MPLTQKEKDEIVEVMNKERKAHWLLDWSPLAMGIIGIIGAAYVGIFRLGLAEQEIEHLDEKKAEKVEVLHLQKETDLKLQLIQKDVANINESGKRIEKTQTTILDELRNLK